MMPTTIHIIGRHSGLFILLDHILYNIDQLNPDTPHQKHLHHEHLFYNAGETMIPETQAYAQWYVREAKDGPCDECKRLRYVRWVVNPYLLEEYNESVEGWFCWDCYRKLASE